MGGVSGQDRLKVKLEKEFHPTEYCEVDGQDLSWHQQCQGTEHVWHCGARAHKLPGDGVSVIRAGLE